MNQSMTSVAVFSRLGMLAVVSGLSTLPLTAANIITNGSFELHSTTGTRRDFTGWTFVDSGTSDWAAEASRGSIGAAQDGGWFAISDQDNLNAYFYQTFATEIGITYELSFYVARPNTTTSRSFQLDVDVFNGSADPTVGSNGNLFDLSLYSQTGGQNNDVPASTAGTWNFFSGYQFTATSTQSTLRFLDVTSIGVDPAIDNVVISAVPESSTALLGGLGLLLLLRRHHSSN